jgi:hypothetical protein
MLQQVAAEEPNVVSVREGVFKGQGRIAKNLFMKIIEGYVSLKAGSCNMAYVCTSILHVSLLSDKM